MRAVLFTVQCHHYCNLAKLQKHSQPLKCMEICFSVSVEFPKPACAVAVCDSVLPTDVICSYSTFSGPENVPHI